MGVRVITLTPWTDLLKVGVGEVPGMEVIGKVHASSRVRRGRIEARNKRRTQLLWKQIQQARATPWNRSGFREVTEARMWGCHEVPLCCRLGDWFAVDLGGTCWEVRGCRLSGGMKR